MLDKLRNTYKLWLPILVASILFSCQKNEEKSHKQNTYVVKRQLIQQNLYFTGVVQPIHETLFVSPFNAVVKEMNYQYGQFVHKNDIVITLNSEDLQKQYNDLLTTYLKAKDSFLIAKAKFNGSKSLWDAGLLSKNNYMNETSSVSLAKITLMQATRNLKELLSKVESQNGSDQSIAALSIDDFAKVKKALTRKYNLIHLKAPRDGILLLPPKGAEDQVDKLGVGTALKEGQVIALLGDLSGIKIEIEVPEIDINNIYPGMLATISGLAFGKEELRGKLIAVNAQASTNTNSLPTFKAIVAVNLLSKEQQKHIKIGMSANITLQSEQHKEIVLPMDAISQENGKAVVLLLNQDGTFKKQIVTTGIAQRETVIIASGLKEGDIVAYPGEHQDA